VLSAAAFFGSFLAGVLFLVGCRSILACPNLARTNYANRQVPTSAGFIFVPVYLLVYVAIRLSEKAHATKLFAPGESLLILIIGMCLLGIIDDMLGDRDSRGFKGHLRALFKGDLTTGLIKAIGGLLIAAAASFWFSNHLWELALNVFLIALCANIFNLLDTRPGRALKVFFPLLAAAIALNWRMGDAFIPYLLSVGAVALVLLPGDLRERFMLGDAGSNVLGATVGLALALGAGKWWKLGLVILLGSLNLLSERYSFSRLIESKRALRWADLLGRKGHGQDKVKYT